MVVINPNVVQFPGDPETTGQGWSPRVPHNGSSLLSGASLEHPLGAGLKGFRV